MSDVKTRKVHTLEFEAKVGQWKKAIQEQAKILFEGKRGSKPTAAHRESERLYSEIGKLKM